MAITSCDNEELTKEAIVEVTEDGREINKSDTLSVEDILLLQQSNKGPWLSYKSILANDVEKDYSFCLSENEKAECKMISSNKNVKLTISKAVKSKESKKDKVISQRVYFCTNDTTCIDLDNDADINYNVTLGLKNRMSDDSMINVQLDVYKTVNNKK